MWKQEYAKILGSPEVGALELSRAEALKRANLPRRLFKYRAVNEQGLAMLRTGQVWLASPATFNDPLDSAVTFNLQRVYDVIREAKPQPDRRRSLLYRMVQGETLGLPPSVRDLLLDATTGLYRKLNRGVVQYGTNKLHESLRISCFSETCVSAPMWAHYADNHRGFCAEWDLSTWSQNDIARLFPVLYDEHPFQMPSLAFNPHYDGAEILLSLRKAADWSYEREWRYVVRGEKSASGHLERLPVPTAIHLGLLVSTQDRKKLQNLCAELRLELHQLRCDLEFGCLDSVGSPNPQAGPA